MHHLDRKGRGLALRESWGASEAAVVVYMDVDLSTGLDGLLPLVAPLLNGHSDLAIGSRLAPGARTVRGPRRELVSRAYKVAGRDRPARALLAVDPMIEGVVQEHAAGVEQRQRKAQDQRPRADAQRQRGVRGRHKRAR